jgi:molecular chaperone HtpG
MDQDKYTSLEDYITRLPAWQSEIYYIAAESQEAASKSPFMQVARKKGVEVLYLSDPIDEYAIQNLGDFDGHKVGVVLNTHNPPSSVITPSVMCI